MIMQITIEVPDELAERLLGNEHSPLSRQVLEVLAVEAYKADRLTSAEVGRILGLSRWEVDAFLKQHQAYLDC
jgi:chromosome segregation and condensation protein ScpB